MDAPITEGIPEILQRFEDTSPVKRLRVRVRDLGDDAGDEVAQFKMLQRACRELPELSMAFVSAGYGDLTRADPRSNDAKMGVVIQAFNRFIEESWETE
jgi:hypothetical protein